MKELTLPARCAALRRRQAYRVHALTLLLTACRLGGYAPLSLALTGACRAGAAGTGRACGRGAGRAGVSGFPVRPAPYGGGDPHLRREQRVFRHEALPPPGFRPAVSAGMFLLVQSVYLLHRLAAEVMACFAAAALLAGCVWYGLRETEGEKRRPAAFLLLAALSIALCGAAKGGKFDFGCAFAALALLFAATESAPGLAAALGAGLGLALDLTGEPPQLLLTALCGAGVRPCRVLPGAPLADGACAVHAVCVPAGALRRGRSSPPAGGERRRRGALSAAAGAPAEGGAARKEGGARRKSGGSRVCRAIGAGGAGRGLPRPL